MIENDRNRKALLDMAKVVLASGSPRRKELLEQVGVVFEILVANGEEIITKTRPCEVVEELSYMKAQEVANQYQQEHEVTEDTVIIGADTIVAFDEEILGKPKNEEDARNTLDKLQNHTHQVYTGVTVIVLSKNGSRSVSFHEKTDVTMYPTTKEQIAAYVATLEPMDKAGSYGIQGKGAALVKGINGDYNNVVGLPVARLLQEARALGVELA